jgi:hypothetical protein
MKLFFSLLSPLSHRAAGSSPAPNSSVKERREKISSVNSVATVFFFFAENLEPAGVLPKSP